MSTPEDQAALEDQAGPEEQDVPQGQDVPEGQTDSDTPADALCFEQVEVRRFHGLDHGLEASLCEGVNVIYGSNASGKTTLAQAIRAILWPEEAGEEFPIASAQFELGGSAWRVELEGGQCSYEKDHAPASPPSLPPSAHGPRYHLYLHDLLRGEGQEEDFARQILQEAQGGIDVEAAAEELGFEVPSRRTAQITTDVESLRQKRDKTRGDQKELRRKERALDDLREKRSEAREAARRASAIRQAKEVARARRAYEEAEATLEEFPEVMGEVRGDEGEILDGLQEEVGQADKNIQEAEGQIESAEETIEESPIPDEGLPEGRVEELRTVATTIQEQEREVRRRRTDLEEAEQREEDRWKRLPTGTEKEAAASIDLPELEEVEAHAKATEGFRGRKEAFETAEELFAGAGPDTPAETLRDGLRQLHRWLQRPGQTDETGQTGQKSQDGASLPRWIGGAGGLVVLASGVALVLIGSEPTAMIGALLAVVGALILGAEWWRGGGSPESKDEGKRSLHEEEFSHLGLPEPSEWSREAVEDRSDALFKRLREAQVESERQETWTRLQPEYEGLSGTAEELKEERKRLAEEMGIEPDVGSHSLFVLLERLSRWQAAYDEVSAKETALGKAREQAEKCRTRLNEALETYDLGPAEDASQAQRAVEALETARNEFQEAARDLELAQEKKKEATEDRDEAQRKIRGLYDRLELERGAENELRELAQQHEDYQDAADEKREAKAELSAGLGQLRREEAHAEWMEEATEEALGRELQDAQSEAEKEEKHVQEIESIKHQIEDAREKGTLEELQARYRGRRNDLAGERQGDFEKAAGSVLADFVGEKTRDRGLPPVFHRARDLFAEITGHRYQLTLDRESAVFRAEDTVYERTFGLEELSSGTQVQLLLAVRIAFLETQEQACRLPLVLDETLANSDEERARAIIDAVKTICEEGRQVFYLTAQADEVQKWQACLSGQEGPKHTVIPLEELDARDLPEPGGDGAAVPVRNAPENLPDPGDASHEELKGALEVPDWSPRQPVGRLHLWYLVESPAPLTDLLESGTRTWGQLGSRHQLGGTGATPFKEEEFQRVQARAQAVSSWKEAWHVGRGEPVGRRALEKTDAVTATFIDGVTEIAKEQDGNAEAVLRVVRERKDERVKGFRSSKADDLEEYFLEHGYLVRQDPLSSEEMLQRVLADLAEELSSGVISGEGLERLFSRLQLSSG
nr:AAA family ATPase [Salinibacter ruber]